VRATLLYERVVHALETVFLHCECSYVCPEKLTHLQMRLKAEIWQLIEGASKPEGKI
jgi:hypothetical protein